MSQKHIFAVLLILKRHLNTDWKQPMNGVGWGDPCQVMAFCISQKSQKDADLVVLAYFSGQIHVSQQPFIQSIWFQGHFRLVLFYSFHWLRLILEAETFSSIFLFSEMPLSKAAI